jgi:hypothetical protein
MLATTHLATLGHLLLLRHLLLLGIPRRVRLVEAEQVLQ